MQNPSSLQRLSSMLLEKNGHSTAALHVLLEANYVCPYDVHSEAPADEVSSFTTSGDRRPAYNRCLSNDPPLADLSLRLHCRQHLENMPQKVHHFGKETSYATEGTRRLGTGVVIAFKGTRYNKRLMRIPFKTGSGSYNGLGHFQWLT